MSLPGIELSAGARTWRLEIGEHAVIGRGPESRIMVDDPMVSRVHATLFYEEGWWIRDENSGNGLWINGRRAQRHRLSHRDVLGLGDPQLGAVTVQVSVQETAPAQPTGTHPTVIVGSPFAVRDKNLGADPTTRFQQQSQRLSSAAPTTALPAAPTALGDFADVPDSEATQWRLPKRGLDPAAATAARSGSGTRSIGRGSSNDIPVQDVLASRRHALLHTNAGQIMLEDLGSLNGTFVNDRRLIGTIALQDGDKVVIGNSDFTVALALGEAELRPRVISGGLLLESVGFSVPVGRKSKALLTDVEFQAATGELVAVLGPSGAGKSTLMNVMTGANAPSAGAVYFDDHDITADYEALRSRIGFVPQEDIIHRGLTVAQALGYAARLRLPTDTTAAERRERAEEVMETLGLLEHANTRVDRLSGGQRKRASVALELLTEPSLLILDEPTSGLDPAMDKQVTEMLRVLANAGRVVVVVTHNVANLNICDKVLVLAKGGLPAYVGPPDKVLEKFAARDWAELFTIVSEKAQNSYEGFRATTPRRLPRSAEVKATGASAVPAKAPRRPWPGQVSAIAARQLRLLVADRGYFAFLAALPLVLGGLTLVVPGSAGFGIAGEDVPREASQLLVLLIFGAAFLGMALSVRDLVGERSIFLRERSVGLDAAPYLLAKTLVYTVIALLQAAVLTFIVLLFKPVPANHLLSSVPGVDLYLAVAGTAVSCTVVGLLISACVRSNDQVMPLLVVTAMVQLVLCGGIIPVTGRIVLDQLSWLSPARWGYAAGASSMDFLNLLAGQEWDRFWVHGIERFVFALGAMAALTLICWVVAWLCLARRGVTRR